MSEQMLLEEIQQNRYLLELREKQIRDLKSELEKQRENTDGFYNDLLELFPENHPCQYPEITGETIFDAIKDLQKPTKRYRFSSDDDGHNYLIPDDKLEEWSFYLQEFYRANDACEPLPEEPVWAKRIDSHELWSFENPKLEK